MKVEIRCCCDVGLVMGIVEVPSVMAKHAVFELTNGVTLILPFGNVYSWGNQDGYRAIKSEDTPLETLRKIPGFDERMRHQYGQSPECRRKP